MACICNAVARRSRHYRVVGTVPFMFALYVDAFKEFYDDNTLSERFSLNMLFEELHLFSNFRDESLPVSLLCCI